MDELWRALPGERVASVHMALFPMGDELAAHRDPALLATWARLAVVRDQVNLALEQKRQEQLIKANLSARVHIDSAAEDAALLAAYEEFLPTLFGVSQVELATPPPGAAGGTTPGVRVEPATGTKCQRCWRFVPEVSADPAFAGLCSRCVGALAPAVH
jgi:isoleucyl-tRNA synthetase